MPKSSESKKVMDVSTKGATPSETSRPVIVSNRRIVQDPMMKSDDTKAATEDDLAEPKRQTLAMTGKTLQPLSAPAEEEKAEALDTAATETVEDQPADKPADSDTADEDDSSKQAKEEAAIVDAVASQAGGKKKDKKIETDDTKQKAIQKLIEDKKYFLPIGQITKRKQNRQVLAVAAFLVIALAGSYLALDLELVESPVDLPFRFFNGR